MGLNLRDSNASLAATEAGYVIQKYDSTVIGFEIGNEPDQYAKRRYRGNTYWDTNYEKEYMKYYNTIREKQPTAVFTGPACSSSYKEFTLPFCRKMDTIKTGSSVTNDHSENNKHLLNPYPNPASEKVTVNTDLPEHSVISIYNLQGQLLLQQPVQPGKTDIDISDLAKGVYILRLYSNAGVAAGRIMKE